MYGIGTLRVKLDQWRVHSFYQSFTSSRTLDLTGITLTKMTLHEVREVLKYSHILFGRYKKDLYACSILVVCPSKNKKLLRNIVHRCFEDSWLPIPDTSNKKLVLEFLVIKNYVIIKFEETLPVNPWNPYIPVKRGLVRTSTNI